MIKKLNFGCGKKIFSGWVNVDIQNGQGIDKSFNFNKFPYPFKENTFDYVFSENVIEHLDDPNKVLDELWRICKNQALVRIIVPYFNSSGAYNDVTHKHYFNERTFDVMVNVHKYYGHKKKQHFKIKKIDLVPTRLGKLIYPKKIRWLASLVLGDVISEMHVELIVTK